MATTNTWDQVVSKITGVANRGAFSKTYTPSTSKQTQNGSAGYYSSITTVCNAVSLSGNAATSQVLTGRTFYTTSLTKQTGTMANRGNLNWNPGSSTSYSVPAGYYSGGTLNSSSAYNAGYNNGVNAGVNRNSIGISHYSRGTSCDNSTSSESNYTVSNLAAGTYIAILSYYTGSYSNNYDTSKLNASLTFSGGSILKTLSWNDFSTKQKGHAAYIIQKVKFSSGSNSTRFTAYGVSGFSQDVRRIIIKL